MDAMTVTLRPEDVAHDTQTIVGRGGSGIVHRGTLTHRDGRPAEPAAIKRLQAGATSGEQRRFQKEFAVLEFASERYPRACRLRLTRGRTVPGHAALQRIAAWPS